MMREKANSASCSRQGPCADCSKVLSHFHVGGDELWEIVDARGLANKRKVRVCLRVCRGWLSLPSCFWECVE